MNSNPKSIWAPFPIISDSVRKTFLALIFATGIATSVHAQGDIPSGTVSSSGSGPYTYALAFADASGSTSPIGSVWYSWIPGSFFCPATRPAPPRLPAGRPRSLTIRSQFSANSPANDITAGSSLSGFSYTAAFTPAQLASAANSAESVAYAGGIQSDAGVTFVVSSVPEPSTLALLALGTTALVGLSRRRKFRAG